LSIAYVSERWNARKPLMKEGATPTSTGQCKLGQYTNSFLNPTSQDLTLDFRMSLTSSSFMAGIFHDLLPQKCDVPLFEELSKKLMYWQSRKPKSSASC